MERLEDRLVPAGTTPDTNMALASFFDSAIYKFDSNTGAVVGTLVAPNSQSILSGPAGMTTGPDGNLYLSSQFNNSIVKYNVTTNALSTFINAGVLTLIASANGNSAFAPAGLRFGPDGNLYVSLNGGQSSTSGGAVVRFGITNGGGQLAYGGTNATIATGLIQPTELTFGSAPADQNNLYVSNAGADNVIKITRADAASPTSSTFITAGSGGLNYPSGLVWGGDGKLYVVDLGATSHNGQVLRFNANGSFDIIYTQPSTSLQFQFPSDAAFNANGNLLTANLGPANPPHTQGSVALFGVNGTFGQTLVSSSQFANTGPGTSGISPSQFALNLGNVAATASAGGPYTLIQSSSLTLSGSANDPDGDTLTYSWDVNGDGTFGDATGANPTLTWAQLQALGISAAGTFNVRVEVNDSHGHVTTSAPTTLSVRIPLVAASVFDSAVYEFDTNTGAVLNTLVAPYSQSILASPAGMTTGPDGNLYFSSQGNDSIVKYDLATGTLSTFISASVLGPIATANGDTVFAPAGLRFGPDGNLYVSLNGGQNAVAGGAVLRFGINNAGGQVSFNGTTTTVATGLVQPTELTFGTAPADRNNLYVSNSGSSKSASYASTPHNVIKITHADGATATSSIFIATNSGVLNYPSGLTWGADGKLYVVDLGATSPFNGKVVRFDANGTNPTVFTQPANSLTFKFPSDAVFDLDGNLLTANLGTSQGPALAGSIAQFGPSGTFTQTLVSSSQFPNTGTGKSGVAPSQFTLDIGNRTPTASAGSLYDVQQNASLTLNAGASSDPDGDSLTYTWDVNGDGTYGDATGVNPTLTWAQLAALGTLTGPTSTLSVRVQVSDGHSHVATSPAAALTIHDNPAVAVSYFDSAVYEFDTATGVLMATLVAPNSQATLSGPAGMTVGPDGNLYLSSQNNNTIVKYDMTTHALSTFISASVLAPIATANGAAAFAPAGLRFGPDGNLYVSLNAGQGTTSGGAVVRFGITSSGGQITSNGTNVTIATNLVEPTELAFGTAPNDRNNLYVSNSGSSQSAQYASTPHNVIKITHADGATSTSSIFIPTNSGGLNYPSGLVWGADGKLYVVDLGATTHNGQVLRFKADGSFDTVYTQPSTSLQFQFPSDAVFDANGNLLTADLGPAYPPNLQGSIAQFGPTGTFIKTLLSSSQFPNTGTGTSGFSPSQLTLNLGNHAPTIVTAANYNVVQNASLTLNASGSTDPDGDTLTYTWDVNGDGTYGDATGVSPTLTWAQLAALGTLTGPISSLNVRVEVSDGHDHVVTSTPAVLTIHDNPVVAASFFDGAVYEFDTATGVLMATLVAPNSQATLSGPAGMTTGPDGNLYFSSQFNNSIVRYTLNTHVVSTFIDATVLGLIATANGDASFAPAGLRFGPDGNLYVSLNGGQSANSGGAVVRFGINSSGGQLTYSGTNATIATGLIQPTEMTFGTAPADQSSLYVSNAGADNVIKIAHADGATPTKSTFIAAGSGGLNYPSGLIWGADGKLYVVDLGATSHVGQVLRFNANGSFDTVYTQPSTSLQFQFPSDAVFDATGNLLTADLGPAYPPNLQGSIAQFGPTGTFLQTLVGSSRFPNIRSGTSGFSPSQLTLGFGNHAPTANAGGLYTINEGSSLPLNAGASSDVDGDTLTYSWDVNGDGTFGDAMGVSPTLTWAQLNALGIDGPTARNVAVRVSDGNGHMTTSTAVTLTVNGVPPALTNIGLTPPTQGNPATLTGNIVYPGKQATYTLVVNWGDGSAPQTFTYAAQTTAFSETHTFFKTGSQQLSLTLTDSDGGGQGTVVATFMVGSAPPNQLLAKQFYVKILDRDPTSAETALWQNALSSGLSESQAVQGFVKSPEYLGKLTSKFYTTYLGRAANAGEIDQWTAALQHGLTYEQMIIGFLSSDEFLSHAGGTTPAFVQGLYAQLLGRTASSGEVNVWANALSQGMSRATAVGYFLSTSEFAYRSVNLLYQDYLGRPGLSSDPGVQNWANQFIATEGRNANSGQFSNSALLQAQLGILASGEFATDIDNLDHTGYFVVE